MSMAGREISEVFLKLWCAVEKGDAPSALAALKAGAPINCKEPLSGLTPLMLAAGYAHADLVSLLLEQGADPNILDDKAGTSALHKAAQGGSVEAAKALLEHGAFIDLQTPTYGHTPLHEAMWYKHVEIVKLFLAAGANLNITTRYGFNLERFIEFGLQVSKRGREKLLAIKEAVEARQRADENWLREHRLTDAVLKGDISGVRAAIAAGEDLNQRHPVVAGFDDGYTPLLIAARNGAVEIVKLLIDAGADVRARDAMFCAEPVHKAAYMGHAEVARVLIDSGKADINVQGPMNGYTPLHDSLWHANTEAAEAFLEAGAQLDIRAWDGLTPLQIAEEIY